MNKAKSKQVTKALLTAQWIFAKTMPEISHWYTLRREWGQEISFDEVVLFISAHGYSAEFCGKSYIYLDIGEMCYWTMGEPLEQTILINRARKISKK